MKFHFSNSLILRTPRFSFIELPLSPDFKTDDIFLEAIYIASPTLYDQIIKNASNKSGKYSLAKYRVRATTRCTPFGLYAGCSPLAWSSESNILISGEKRHTRFDMSVLLSMVAKIQTLPEIKNKIKFYPNSSIYKTGYHYRYIEYSHNKLKRTFNLNSVEQSEEVSFILKFAKEGKTKFELVAALTSDGLSFSEVDAFINILISNQLLISELEPAITGIEYLPQLLKILQKLSSPEALKLYNDLERIKSKLSALDASFHNTINSYQIILGDLNQINFSYDESKVFQTDLIKLTSCNQLSIEYQKTIESVIDPLLRLSSPINRQMNKFIERFISRYGDQEAPLLAALDMESGVGYPDPYNGGATSLTKDVTLPLNDSSKKVSIKWEKLDDWLSSLLIKANYLNDYIVDLQKEDWENFAPQWGKLLPSCSVTFRVTNFKKKEIYIESAGGSSAVNIMSRFGHADKEIEEVAKAITNEEEIRNPDIIFAEIIHLPEDRLGNVLVHPTYRKFEIPYLGKSSVKADYQIPLQDLSISVIEDQIILRSKTLKKQVIPRLSNSHNFALSELPVYRFLCDLQCHNRIGSFGFDWGSLSSKFIFLPRVIFGKAILSLATWQLARVEWEHLLHEDEKKENLLAFKEKWKLPQYCVLAEEDNELFIDFDNELTLLLLRDAIKNKKKIILKEFLFDAESPIRDGKNLPYHNQFICSIIKNDTSYKPVPAFPQSSSSHDKVERTFIVGSDWVYMKYYCGIKNANKILTNHIKPFTERCLSEGVIDQWFFIRYQDPSPHLRIRFHLTKGENLSIFLSRHQIEFQALINKGIIANIQMDSYHRELERYGHDTVALAEQLFFNDSVASLNLFSNSKTDEVLWLYGIAAINQLLIDFRLPLKDITSTLRELKEAFYEEFKVNKPTKLSLDKKYRNYKKKIEMILIQNDSTSALGNLSEIINKKSIDDQKIVEKILVFKKEQKSSLPLRELLKSFIHMLLNRLISHNQRFHEMVIYDFMHRTYLSKKVRLQREKVNAP